MPTLHSTSAGWYLITIVSLSAVVSGKHSHQYLRIELHSPYSSLGNLAVRCFLTQVRSNSINKFIFAASILVLQAHHDINEQKELLAKARIERQNNEEYEVFQPDALTTLQCPLVFQGTIVF